MGFLQDLTNKAKNIASKGKSVILDQLSNETTYEPDASGNFQVTSTTGNKPKIVKTAKDFVLPNRGYSDEQIKAAQPTTKEKVVGLAKAGGEIAQGGLTLVHMLGNKIADVTLPGYNGEAVAESRNKLNEKISAKLAPKTAGEAKTMRIADSLGFAAAPIKASKLTKLDELSDLARNSLKNDKSGVREDSLKYFREDPKRVQEGEVRLREVEDGSIVIEDGRHRLQVGAETGTKPNIVDVTSEYTGKPSQKVAQLKMEVEAQTIPSQKTATTPKTPTGEVDVNAYSKQLDVAREASRGGKSTITERIGNFFSEANKQMVEFTAPIGNRYKQALKDDPVFAATQKNTANIEDNIDRVLNVPSITKAFVNKNGLAQAVQEVDDMGLFSNYLTAKHSLDLNDKGISVGYKSGQRSLEGDAALVAKYSQQFSNAEKQIRNYTKALLDYGTESGLINKDTVDLLLEKHPNYVPSARVFSKEEEALNNAFNNAGVASLSKQTFIQKMTGSERAIESPLESLLEKTEQLMRQGEKNKAAQTIVSYADIKDNPFGLRQITGDSKPSSDMDTISLIRDGKKETWEVYPDVARAAKALDVERMDILTKVLSYPMRTVRLGITGVLNPAFMMANVARDQLAAPIFADKGLRSSAANPLVFGKALAEAIGHGKVYNEMLEQGAIMTSFDAGRDGAKLTLKQLQSQKNLVAKGKYVATTPTQWFRMIENAIGRSEEVTRIQQYIGHKQAYLAEGMTEAQAKNLAARAARENSTNFARRGELGTLLNSQILYFGAGVQGSRLLLRSLKNKPLKTATGIATNLFFPAAVLTYYNLSDPERKEAYESLQDYERENNLIFVPPNPTKDENGRWNVYKFPLPPGIGQFANFVRRPIEASQGLDELAFSEAASNLLRVVSPIDLTNPVNTFTPPAIKGGVQAATNQNLFTGYDIVPKSLQDDPVEEQYTKKTSGTVIDIANTLGVSPIKLEQFLADQTGAASPQILNAVDRIRGEEQIGGRSVLENISRRFTSAAGGKQEAEKLEDIYDKKEESAGRSTERKREAEKIALELSGLSKQEQRSRLIEIAKQDELLFDAIVNVKSQEVRDLDDIEKGLEALPVKDGTRAAYIYEDYITIKQNDPKAAKEYLKNLIKKKIITDAVLEQIAELHNSEEF